MSSRNAPPPGWSLPVLAEIAKPEKGAIRIGPFGSALKKHEYSDSGVRVLGIEDVFPNKLDSTKRKYIPRKKFDELRQYQVTPGDLLVTNMGTVGRTCVVPIDLEQSIISSHLIKVTLDRGCAYPPYVSWVLNSCPEVVAQVKGDSRGAIMAGFNTGLLKNLRIPLPPLPEQRRIAAILDQAEGLRAKRRQALGRLDALTQSIFVEMFGDPIRNTKQWKVHPFAAEFRAVRYGTGSPPEYVAQGVPFIRATDIKQGRIRGGDLKRVSVQSAKDLAKCRVSCGNLIIVRSGVNTGDCALVPRSLEGALAAFDLVVDIEEASGIFYSTLINSSFGKVILAPLTRRAAQAHLNSDQVKNLRVIAPPQELRLTFSKRLAAAEAVRREAESSLVKLDTLFASLQHRAFRGEL